MTPRPPQAAAAPGIEAPVERTTPPAVAAAAPTRPAGGPTRLERLLDLRDRLDEDIAREMGRQRTRTRAAATGSSRRVCTRQEWSGQLIAAAAVHYGLSPATLRSRARDDVTAQARHVACWLLREAGRSYGEIGRELAVHHTSALHGVRRVARDPEVVGTARRLYRALTEEAA